MNLFPTPLVTGFFAKVTRLVAPLFVAGGLTAPAADASARPNIIFILVDDLRWDALSCMGHPVAKTPNIDRIAKEGVLFRNFFVSIPLCSPSRSSFLTGQYVHTTGVVNNGDHSALSHQLVTFPKLLHDAGYATAYVGKWHMGTDDSPRPGFDRWVSFKGQGAYEKPNINMDGKASKVEGYMTDILNGHALDFVKQEHKQPFVLYLAHKAVHGPFTPAERHKNLYADAKLPLTPNHQDTLEGKPALTREVPEAQSADATPKKKRVVKKAAKQNGAPTGHENAMRQQLRALAAIDEGVGQLLKALEESKQLDNTMVIFTSDNGFFWGEHGLGDKRWAYEESIRDPLLVRYPKLIQAGTTRDQMVLNIDIAPTLLDLAGAPVPKSVQGRSLLPLFKDAKTPWRSSILSEYFQEGQNRTPDWQAARTDRWKYIHYPTLDGMDELYDLKADPYEMKNLIKDGDAQPALKKMTAELAKMLKETDAK
jgi:arylsulfatase A-like enzyme